MSSRVGSQNDRSAARSPVPDEGWILVRLAEVGYEVGSLAELRTSGGRYVTAVPILLEALAKTEDGRALEEIVRALSVPWARAAATGPLIDTFRRAEYGTDSVRWAVGNALEVVWDDAYFDELVDLACDRSYGRAREMVVLGLAKSKRPEAGDVLIDLLDDPDVNGHATDALRKLRVPRAREGLERMTTDSRAWVRRSAKDALKKLDALERRPDG